jgi:hypothetical protein
MKNLILILATTALHLCVAIPAGATGFTGSDVLFYGEVR